MVDVFISYPREAAKDASLFANALKAKGVETWYAQENLSPGDDWKNEIQAALKNAAAVAFLLIPDSQPTSTLEGEYMSALESYWAGRTKLLVPVVLGEAEPPGFLRQWQSIKVNKKSDWERAADQFVMWLKTTHGPDIAGIKQAKEERSQRLQAIDNFLRAYKKRAMSATAGEDVNPAGLREVRRVGAKKSRTSKAKR